MYHSHYRYRRIHMDWIVLWANSLPTKYRTVVFLILRAFVSVSSFAFIFAKRPLQNHNISHCNSSYEIFIDLETENRRSSETKVTSSEHTRSHKGDKFASIYDVDSNRNGWGFYKIELGKLLFPVAIPKMKRILGTKETHTWSRKEDRNSQQERI